MNDALIVRHFSIAGYSFRFSALYVITHGELLGTGTMGKYLKQQHRFLEGYQSGNPQELT